MGDWSVVFDRALMDLFASASHDRNPLHTSVEYARATAYGEPVVFGVLAGLAVLARMPGVGDRRICRVKMSFSRPVVVGRRYDVAMTETGNPCRGELRGADGLVVTVIVDYSNLPDLVDTEQVGHPPGPATIPVDLAPMRDRPTDSTMDRLRPGLAVAGHHRADQLAELIAELGLDRGALSKTDIAALLWVSYLAGMELPGQQALLASFTAEFRSHDSTGRHWYRAEVSRVDRRFRLVHVTGLLLEGSRPVAGVSIRAFVRPTRCVIEPAGVRAALTGVPDMAGRTAVIIGASRGLGAATSMALAQLGCRVIGCYHISRTSADELAGGQCPSPPIQMLRGDAGNMAFCTELAQHARRRLGRVDMLVCSASPALQPMRLGASSAVELVEYVSASVRLVAMPVAAFLPLLETAGGQVLMVSTQAFSAPPANWPHYVAAKGAVEHLLEALAPAHPKIRFLVFRPPRMDTDYVLSLSATEVITSPVDVAANLVRELSRARGKHEVFSPEYDGAR